MKKLIAICLIFALFCCFVTPARADDPVKKLGRGIANVASSPLEVISGMGSATEEDGIIAGFTWGVLEGTVDMIKRLSVGAFEVVTFPVPIPAGYEPILDDPEFFLEKEGVGRL